jgi:hypothetical protein
MELSPSQEVASSAATQELPSMLWNPKVHYHVNKSPLLATVPSQISPFHSTQSYVSKIHHNIIQILAFLMVSFLWLSHQ